MGLTDRIKAASSAATDAAAKGAARAQEAAGKHASSPEGLTQSMRETAQSLTAKGTAGISRVREHAESNGVDLHALSSSATDGLAVTNRHGEVKRWKVAKAALRPGRTTRGLATSLAREALRQRRELLAAGRALAAPGVNEFVALDLDEQFFTELIDWIVADSGAEDTEDLRAEIYVRLAIDGIDAFAASVLAVESLSRYRTTFHQDTVDLVARSSLLLDLDATAKPGLLEHLERTRLMLTKWFQA